MISYENNQHALLLAFCRYEIRVIMGVKSTEGGWLVDIRPQGRSGPRVRRKFLTKSEAQQFERWAIATQNNKEWKAQTQTDPRSLGDLIDLWWTHHGLGLTSGSVILKELNRICADLGNPRAEDFSKKHFSEYRGRRLEAGIKPATINREQAILSGVFTILIKLEIYTKEHPLTHVMRIKNPQKEMYYLTNEEIDTLLGALKGDNLKIARLCLSTGARWDEAASLSLSAVTRHKVTFNRTKTGLNRTVPIAIEMYVEITGDNKKKNLFPAAHYNKFRNLLKTLFDLPDGQATHVLRHTFSAHFMMNGGNILTLQKILGHASINQTMTYAHLAPDYLSDAVLLNPLNKKHPHAK